MSNYIDIYLRELMNNFINMNKYFVKDEADRDFINMYILELKQALCDVEGTKTMFSLPEQTVELTRQYIGVYNNGEQQTQTSVADKNGMSLHKLYKLLSDFYWAAKGDLYKRMYNRKKYQRFVIERIGKEQAIGIHTLELPTREFNILRKSNVNSLQDLSRFTTYELWGFEHLGEKAYATIVEKFHNLGYKFLDEKEEDIEELKTEDKLRRKEMIGIQKKKTLKELEKLLNQEN